jgi:hypothetical protein
MANGGTNTYTAAVQRAVQAGDKRALQELAKPVNYGAAARTPDGQNALRLATQALAQSTQISTDAAVDVPVSDAERMAANRSNLGAIRGRVSQDALTDQAMAQINAANRPSKPPVTGPRPDVAQRAENMASIASQDRTESTPLINNPPSDSAMDQIKRAFMYPGEVLGFGVPDDAPGKPNPIGQGIRNFVFGTEESQSPVQSALRSADDAIVRGTSAAGDAIQNLEKGIISGFIPKPTDAANAALADAQAAAGAVRESFPGRTAGEQLAENTVTSGGSQSVLDGTDPDADASITNNDVIARKVGTVDPDAPPPKTAAVKKLEAIRNNVTSNVPDGVKGKAPKLSVNEALDPEVLPELANNIADRVAVKDVDLKKIDAELKKEFNFDPSKASKEKEGAFWTALMQAGLAIAAGESENALTNIAKGLSLGVDAYGKAVGELNEQEREDRKEMRQARRQLIRDERSFNIADAAAANQYNQYMTTAKQKFEVDKRTLGIQEATLEFNKADKIATRALAMQQFEANLAVLIAAEDRKDRTLVINEKTLQATIDKLEPKNITTFRRLGYIDADGKVTQLGVDEFGSEKETRAAILAQGTSSKSTDADKNAAAFARALEARRTGQKISAADLARLPQKMQEDFTLLDQFIDDSSTLKKGVAPPVIDLAKPNT